MQARKSAGEISTLDLKPMRKDTWRPKQEQPVAPQNGPWSKQKIKKKKKKRIIVTFCRLPSDPNRKTRFTNNLTRYLLLHKLKYLVPRSLVEVKSKFSVSGRSNGNKGSKHVSFKP